MYNFETEFCLGKMLGKKLPNQPRFILCHIRNYIKIYKSKCFLLKKKYILQYHNFFISQLLYIAIFNYASKSLSKVSFQIIVRKKQICLANRLYMNTNLAPASFFFGQLFCANENLTLRTIENHFCRNQRRLM